MINRNLFALCLPLSALSLLAVPVYAQAPKTAKKPAPTAPAKPVAQAPLRLIPPIGHAKPIKKVAYLNNDTTLTIDDYGIASIWDTETGRQLDSFLVGAAATGLSGDGKTLIVVQYEADSVLAKDWTKWNLETGAKTKLPISKIINLTSSIAVNGDGSLGVTENHLVNFRTGKVTPLPGSPLVKEANPVIAAMNRAGTRGAIVYKNGVLVVWDINPATGTAKLRSAVDTGHTKGLSADGGQPITITMSVDGKRAVTGGLDKKVVLWNLETGKPEQTFAGGHQNPTTAVALSPDGTRVASAEAHPYSSNMSEGDYAVIWDVASGSVVAELSVPNGKGTKPGAHTPLDIAYSPDGKTLMTGGKDFGAYLWDAESGRERLPLKGSVNRITYIAPSPRGSFLAVGTADGTVRLLDSRTGQPQRTFAPADAHYNGQERVTSISVSLDESKIAVVRGDVQSIAVFDRNQKGDTAEAFPTKQGRFVKYVQFLPDGKSVVTTNYASVHVNADKVIAEDAAPPEGFQLWGTDGSLRKETTKGASDIVVPVPGSDKAWVLPRDKNAAPPRIVDAANPDKTVLACAAAPLPPAVVMDGKKLPIVMPPLVAAAVSDDGTLGIAAWGEDNSNAEFEDTVSPDFRMGVWDMRTGKFLRYLDPKKSTKAYKVPVDDFAFFPGDTKRVLVNSGNKMLIVDTTQGTVTQEWTIPVQLVGMFIAPGKLAGGKTGLRVFAAASDATVHAYNGETGREEFTYASLSNGDWLVYTADGRFDGSEGGIAQVSFAQGRKTYALEQFYERFYTPGLLRAALSGEAIPTSGGQLADIVRTGTPPLVKISVPNTAASETVDIAVEATEQSAGGIKAIRLYQNGRLVGGPAALRGITIEPVTGKTTTKRFTVSLAPGENVFRAVAYSNNDIESSPATQSVRYNPPQIPKPTLHLLAVGINTYADSTMNLAYARPDAEALTDFFKPNQSSMSLYANLDVHRLTDAEATGAAISGALTEMAKNTKPDDVVFIYLAGHGETAGGMWHFLPSDARQMAVEERVKQYGIPWSRIETAIGQIPARKIVLVVDACKSGALTGIGTRGGSDEQQAMAIMARAQGIHILTASTAQQYAGEVKELGHGILTYSLLEGMNGKAPITVGANYLSIRDLLSYVEKRVPELAKQYRGSEQYPVPFERGQNFPVIGAK